MPPLPGTLVLNVGEMLQLATGGYLRAAVHRVLPPPPGAAPRLSLPFFYNADYDATVAAVRLPADLVWEARPILGGYPPLVLGKWARSLGSAQPRLSCGLGGGEGVVGGRR